MPGIVRLGDIGGVHSCWADRPNDSASPNVFCDGIAVHRQSDHWEYHTCGDDTHDGHLQTGSSTVFVNGLQIARIGDPISCGGFTTHGSSTAFSG